jgi:hypothetical protein
MELSSMVITESMFSASAADVEALPREIVVKGNG